MARTETDREDLFAEAAALTRRAEYLLPKRPDGQTPVVAGFHRDGRVSVYEGGTIAHHLDPAGRLARAFRTGPAGTPRLYRSQGTTLAELIRDRSPERTTLARRDLPADELAAFLTLTRVQLHTLAAALAAGNVECRRVVGADPRDELAAFLAAALPADEPLAPRYQGKR